MNLRAKPFGLAAALALAMTAGMASAQQIDTGVTLAGNGAHCTVSVVASGTVRGFWYALLEW